MNYSGKSNDKNIIYFNDYRITLFNEYCFRIEKDCNKKFNDSKTQLILNRFFDDVVFKSKIDKNLFEIKFYSYDLIYDFSIDKFILIYKDKKYEIKDYKDSIGGTYVTVDRMDGEKLIYGEKNEYVNGLISECGIYCLHDEDSSLLDEQNDILDIKNNDEYDIYVFLSLYNRSDVIKTFYKLSGFPPLLPSFVFGNWWSRFYPYSQDEYLYLMKKFKKEEIPFSVAIIDMDRHYSWTNGRNIYKDANINEDEFFKTVNGKKLYIPKPYRYEGENWRYGWTGYTFNKILFNDPKKFMDELHSLNLKVGLNIHPADGIAFFEDAYKKMALINNIDISSKESVPFDFTNKTFRDSYFKYTLKPLKDIGNDFWWIDWQQGEESNFSGVTPLWLCNHYFYKKEKETNDEAIILSRFASKGGQRYPLGFSGDAYQTFDSLSYLIKMTIGSSDCGFTYRSHDIGGHMEGIKSGDLYLKFLEFGVFSPINRLHCTCSDILNKDPNLYINGYSDLIKNYLRLRHRMIPYLYSYNFITHKEGEPLIRPIYYEDFSIKAKKFKDSEYIFAENLLVSPFNKSEGNNGITSKKIYFTNSNYYDLKYGYKYKKNKNIKIYRERGDMPLFIKEGGYFILASSLNYEMNNVNEYDVFTTLGNGKFVFNTKENDGKLYKTTFKNKVDKSNLTMRISIDTKLFDKTYNFKVLNIFKIKDIKNENCEINEIHLEGYNLEFQVKNISKDKECIIHISYVPFNSNFEETQFYLFRRLNYVDDLNSSRISLYENIKKSKNFNEIIFYIKNSHLKSINKFMLLEIIRGLK